MPYAGYQHLIEVHALPCLSPAVPARVEAVQRVIRGEDSLLIPPGVAPPADAPPVEHVLFALRHEGVDMAVIDALAAAGVLTAPDVHAAAKAAPNGLYARRLAYLWELLTGHEIEGVQAGGAYQPLFDPDVYYTGDQGKATRSPKWRIEFNGLGTPKLCPVVRRTSALADLLKRDLFAEVQVFAEQARSEGLLDRILSWAYLDETRSSFQIEHEEPPADRAEAFAQVLRNAHDGRPVDEQYLAELQNVVITRPMFREIGYRHQQNWLARGGRGALAVRYVPPPPGEVRPLMTELAQVANDPRAQHPLLHAALCSFAFVYIHPFMDGNGRLSRFLFHQALCATQSLPDGLILPVSAAMHRNEREYLAALEAFSRPARQLWDVRWIDGADFEMTMRCRPSVYRYWDATAQATFSARMALEAMDKHLVGEAHYLASFDRAYTALDRELELPGPLLHRLIVMCVDQHGRMSGNRRNQYADKVPPEDFDTIERVVTREFGWEKPGSPRPGQER